VHQSGKNYEIWVVGGRGKPFPFSAKSEKGEISDTPPGRGSGEDKKSVEFVFKLRKLN